MIVIENKEDWWKVLDDNLTELIFVIKKWNTLRAVSDFSIAVKNKDNELCRKILQSTWDSAPEVPWLDKDPGWNVLCDLLSEYYVFG